MLHAHLGRIADSGFERPPQFLLIWGKLQAGLEARQFGVQQRLMIGRPMLSPTGRVGGIALREDVDRRQERCGDGNQRYADRPAQ